MSLPCSVAGCPNASLATGSWCSECSIFDARLKEALRHIEAALLLAPNAPAFATLDTLLLISDDWRERSYQA